MSIQGWQALLSPENLMFLARGLWITVLVTLVTGAISTIVGLALGTYRSLAKGWAAIPATLFIEAFRNLPVLVLVFFIRFGTSDFGFTFNAMSAAILGLSLYGSALCAETFRAGIESVPRGQLVAARTSGLGTLQAYRFVILPQAWHHALPAYTGQLIVLLQATTLVSAIGVMELTGAATVLFNRNANPLETFALLGVIYFVLDYFLSILRHRMEQKRKKEATISTLPVPHPQPTVPRRDPRALHIGH